MKWHTQSRYFDLILEYLFVTNRLTGIDRYVMET